MNEGLRRQVIEEGLSLKLNLEKCKLLEVVVLSDGTGLVMLVQQSLIRSADGKPT